jgi:hypothetical protein
MQRAGHNAGDRSVAQFADFLVAQAPVAAVDGAGPHLWPIQERRPHLLLSRDLRTHLRAEGQAHEYRALRQASRPPQFNHYRSPWQGRAGRARTVADVRAPLRGPRYAWCYRKYAPR